MRVLYHIFLWCLSLGVLSALLGGAAVAGVIIYFSRDLPDYSQLQDYAPPIVTRLYAGDGRLMQEYAREKRVFLPIEQIPDIVKQAFISSEDQNFHTHEGVDPVAIIRAAVNNLRNAGRGRPEGASTITQQVAKNFLLSNEVSYERKIREAILAYRMENALGKDHILELYLNQIYLGGGSYGVAAAALDYFNKALDELELHEVAYLAALPKAPNNYHPVRNHDRAIARRNYVIGRMEEDGHITPEEAEAALVHPLVTVERATQDRIGAPYFAEEVRRELETRYGEDTLYGGGLAVHTSIDPTLQSHARNALREGLMAYDKRHGWRGPLAELSGQSAFETYEPPAELLSEWRAALITEVSASTARLRFQNGITGVMSAEQAEWTGRGALSAFLEENDVVAVEKDVDGEGYKLQQIPQVRGAIIALDPHTGRVLAMQGGWKHGLGDHFNRATQALRQPGSAFKPFIYLTALEKGFTPATLVLDAPFVIEDRPGHFWSPTNYSNEFYGPTPIRVGVERSRNLMTVRLAHYVGMEAVAETARRFGIYEDMKLHLANSLGAGETTLLNLTAAYGMLVNGGKRLEPTFIDRIQDRRGMTVFRHDTRPCEGCGQLVRWADQTVPEVPDTREQILDPRIAHQMVSILEGAVQRGTGQRLKALNRPLAGKTGTTNEAKDTWFIGFSPDLVAGVYVGYDDPTPLGRKETGASVALPVFKAFMEQALKDTTPMPYRVPKGVRQVRIDAKDGTRAEPLDEKVIWESFIAGTEPDENVYLLDGDGQIRRLPAVIYSDNYLNMQDRFVGQGGLDSHNRIRYTDRFTGTPREAAATTGTGGLY